jgi:hypothetical protein
MGREPEQHQKPEAEGLTLLTGSSITSRNALQLRQDGLPLLFNKLQTKLAASCYLFFFYEVVTHALQEKLFYLATHHLCQMITERMIINHVGV